MHTLKEDEEEEKKKQKAGEKRCLYDWANEPAKWLDAVRQGLVRVVAADGRRVTFITNAEASYGGCSRTFFLVGPIWFAWFTCSQPLSYIAISLNVHSRASH